MGSYDLTTLSRFLAMWELRLEKGVGADRTYSATHCRRMIRSYKKRIAKEKKRSPDTTLLTMGGRRMRQIFTVNFDPVECLAPCEDMTLQTENRYTPDIHELNRLKQKWIERFKKATDQNTADFCQGRISILEGQIKQLEAKDKCQ